MKDFKTIKDTCIANSEMFSRVVEDFLLYNVVNPKKRYRSKHAFYPLPAYYKGISGWLD